MFIVEKKHDIRKTDIKKKIKKDIRKTDIKKKKRKKKVNAASIYRASHQHG